MQSIEKDSITLTGSHGVHRSKLRILKVSNDEIRYLKMSGIGHEQS
jgi:hypothetical protein